MKGEVIAADNFTKKPEMMVEALTQVGAIKWIWLPVWSLVK